LLAHTIEISGTLALPAINAIVRQAVASWDATERIKRLAVSVYQYRREDLDHMWLLAAADCDGNLLGFAALEPADDGAVPMSGRGVLLHGIYVQPDAMGSGIGKNLLQACAGITAALGCSGLLVKAARQSTEFFERCGLQALPPTTADDYPYRFWLAAGDPSFIATGSEAGSHSGPSH
jgi:GNAT superfamily N-acetyltransferase